MRFARVGPVAILFSISLLVACGGGGGGGTVTPPGGGNGPGPTPTPGATATPTPGATATPTPTPTPIPTPTATPTPSSSSTPFAHSWVAGGMGAINGLDDQFVNSNNSYDHNHHGGYDGDMEPGDPGAQALGGGHGATIDGISCDPTMSNNYHVHAFVGLFVNGTEIAIEDGIGLAEPSGDMTDTSSGQPIPNFETYATSCFYHLHTHDASGMIHMEDPNPTGATVDQSIFGVNNLFDIWGITVNATQFGPYSGPVTVYTSGQVSRAGQCQGQYCEVGADSYSLWTGDPTLIPLYSHEVIWYEVGTGNPDALHLPGVNFTIHQ